MKLKLDLPYSKDWKSGYLVTNPEGRRTVLLVNSRLDRSSTSFARYQMSCFLGHYLDPDLQVDHIDGDKTNDSLLNLQLLSRKENMEKQRKGNNNSKEFICPVCGTSFLLSPQRAYKKISPTCSRKCGGIKSHWK